LSLVQVNIGEIHNAPNYYNASGKLTTRHFCSCGKELRGDYGCW